MEHLKKYGKMIGQETGRKIWKMFITNPDEPIQNDHPKLKGLKDKGKAFKALIRLGLIERLEPKKLTPEEKLETKKVSYFEYKITKQAIKGTLKYDEPVIFKLGKAPKSEINFEREGEARNSELTTLKVRIWEKYGKDPKKIILGRIKDAETGITMTDLHKRGPHHTALTHGRLKTNLEELVQQKKLKKVKGKYYLK